MSEQDAVDKLVLLATRRVSQLYATAPRVVDGIDDPYERDIQTAVYREAARIEEACRLVRALAARTAP